MIKVRRLSFINMILAVLLAAGVMTVFRACAAMDDGSWMHCHTVQLTVFAAALAAAAVCFAGWLFRSRKLTAVLNLASAVIAGITFFLPGILMSMCMMDTMRCNAVMKPFVRILSLLLVVMSVIAAAAALKTPDGR